MPIAKMDAVYAKIAEDTTKFNLGDEEVKKRLRSSSTPDH